MTTLDQLSPGQCATVGRVAAERGLRKRLLEMGLTRGARIELLKAAPLGDPLEFKLRDYHLSLRKAEARLIEIDLEG
ncbi:MAG: ferrous iron transport protein A [Anaerolineae bacterium]|nr:ferrous iron transport protein A [Anaerolineae bacterium]